MLLLVLGKVLLLCVFGSDSLVSFLVVLRVSIYCGFFVVVLVLC